MDSLHAFARACIQYTCIYSYTRTHVFVCGCAHTCGAVRDGYKSGTGDHAGVSNVATSGDLSLQVGSFR